MQKRACWLSSLFLLLALIAPGCGRDEKPAPDATPPPPAPAANPTRRAAAAPPPPNPAMSAWRCLRRKDAARPGPGDSIPRPRGGSWQMTALEDPESNVFHKALAYAAEGGPRLLSLGGTAAIVKLWEKKGTGAVGTAIWQKDFGGKFSRMRDAEVADLYGDGRATIAVATHDQGVVAVLRPKPDGSFEVVELDHEPNTFVHEIEIGDLDGDHVLEV